MFNWLKKLFQPVPPPTHPDRPTESSPSNTYRPSAGVARNQIDFRIVRANTGCAATVSTGNLSDINDAFTGIRLDLGQAIYECSSCHVFYQSASMEVLREANNECCMVCGASQIAQYRKGQIRSEARNYTPDTVTLKDYREHFGHVITFTGFVFEVKQSRRGLDYAVMFEKDSWTRGLKMVAFRRGVRKLGGDVRLKGYIGSTLTIRGLLINDPTFGPEIIVDDSAMIIQVT